jgi:hypothetical protein
MRALLTDTERRILRREDDVSRNYRQTVRSRVRDRLRALETDAEILAAYEPDLLADLYRALPDREATDREPWTGGESSRGDP